MIKVAPHTLGLHLLAVNSLLDSGKTEPIDLINKAIEEKNVFDVLESKYGDIQAFDFVSREEVHEALYEMWFTFDGRESRKFWVSNNGLCLIVAYLSELMVSVK